jgi:hypothetical protein
MRQRAASPLFSGNPHRDYARHHHALEEIFSTHFPNWQRTSAATHVAPLAKIPKPTLYKWKANWEANPLWRPWDSEIHGRHLRTFTDQQEEEIAAEIITDYIVPGRLFNASDFRSLALKKFAEFGGESGTFVCSQQFIRDFKKRQRFASRRFHMRRRNNELHRADILAWTDKMQRLLATTDPDRILNCDETCWHVVPSGLLTWAPVGADGISVVSSATEKDVITVLASVTASYRKLPLYLIAKGLTARAERGQLGPHEGHEADHSPSGWSTNETFDRYLRWIRSLYGDTERIHLILDAYSVHRSESSRAVAEELGIELHFIPPGWTDQLQPLDRYVFGALKSVCRRLFHRHCHVHIDGKTGKPDAIRFLIEAWESLAVGVFEKAWAIYEDILGEVGDDSDDEWLPDE